MRIEIPFDCEVLGSGGEVRGKHVMISLEKRKARNTSKVYTIKAVLRLYSNGQLLSPVESNL
jgi:hypothetical protein